MNEGDIVLVPTHLRLEFLQNGWVIPEGWSSLVINEVGGGDPSPLMYKDTLWYPMMRSV